ncbi:MAG: polyphosphate kinase 1 [Castellaniella sp.]
MESTSGDVPVLLNRELSLLKFNERVLAMAENPQVPLLERLRYLCIVSANLDEFFEIRISSLKEQQRQNPAHVGPDGRLPDQAFDQVQQATHALTQRQHALLTEALMPCLGREGIVVFEPGSWPAEVQAWAQAHFEQKVMPLLTPIGLDPARPFPRVYNKSLNFIVALSGVDAFGRVASIAIVQAPRSMPRLLRVPRETAGVPHGHVLLTSLISAFVGDLFVGLEVKSCHGWRVTRNSDLFVDEEEITNLRQALQGELSQRNFGAAVRLEVEHEMPADLELFLQHEFQLQTRDTYRVQGPINPARLLPLCNVADASHLRFSEYRPSIPPPFDQGVEHPRELFAALAKRDRLFHHPYESFQPVLDFLTAAARDPAVVAIKQTIYRTGEDSELMRLLLAAARAGKEVTVIVELMARFDEQTNINWAARLEEVGAHVSYGVVGHKTHAKMALVLRREEGGIRRYAHLGTGNYHPRTARLYTDFGLLTTDPDICEDMERIFSLLTGLGARRPLKRLLQSPFTLHETMLALVRNEALNAREGRPARIMAKMNSLLEPTIIEALYRASQAGVRIDLIVRGACALRPGVPGVSDNIRLRSIVGRFLEHSRVFYFHDNGQEKVYLASADWMDRNFFRRVEVAFPVLDRRLKQRVITEAFRYALRDNQLAWRGLPDGSWVRVRSRAAPFNLHDALMARLGQPENH